MKFHRNNTPQADERWAVVTGPSLSETFKKVKKEYGSEAVISGSRTRSRRCEHGFGTEQVVEVMVERSGSIEASRPESAATVDDMTTRIRYEVERLERLVEDNRGQHDAPSDAPIPGTIDSMTDFLTANGASPSAVRKMMTRFRGETGLPLTDRPGVVAWLRSYLEAGNEPLESWQGSHAFLCEQQGERLDLVLHLARRLTESGRKVLAVSVLPDPDRDVARLQNFAADAGFDAAVLRDTDQLEHFGNRLEDYDLVLTDLPALTDPAMTDGGLIQQWLAANTGFHRHLQIPMTRDFLDLADLGEAARLWNCDSLALTQLDGTRRPAKLLDLVDALPLPVSVMLENGAGTGILRHATPDNLLDTILTAESAQAFTPGLETEGQ